MHRGHESAAVTVALDAAALQRAELALLKSALSGAPLSLPAPAAGLDWDALYAEMQAQAVAALPADALPYADMPAGAAEQWRQCGMRHVKRCLEVLAAQEALVGLLEGAGLRVAVLKGTAAARRYPCPQYRSLGDVDFIASFADAPAGTGEDRAASDAAAFDEACRIMQAAGYVLGDECGSHVHMHGDGVLFEPHRWFVSRPGADGAWHGVDAAIRKGMDALRHVELFGFRMPVLPDAADGLVLAAHMRGHLEQGFGLRHLVDWAAFVADCCDDAFWETEFRPIVAECGLETLAVTAARTAQLYLGLPEQGRTWCAGADEELCDCLMEDVLASGNFGRKLGGMLTADAQAGYWDVRHPLRLLGRAQRVGSGKLARAGYGAPVRAFGWAYQLGFLAKQYAALSGGGRVRFLKRTGAASPARARDEMLADLGIRRRSEKG